MYLVAAAVLSILLIIVVAFLSKPNVGPPAVKPTGNPSTNTSASAEPEPTPSPTATEAPVGVQFTFTCRNNGERVLLHSLEEVWALPKDDVGCRVFKGPGTLSTFQTVALQAAYGDADSEKLVDLYDLCASTTNAQSNGVFVDAAAEMEMLAAFTLCRDHPNAAIFNEILADKEAEGAQQAAAQAEEDARRQAHADGTIVDDGHFLVGKDVQPGTWQTESVKVTNCYWEVSDAQGDIIANNYISTAPQLTITVPTEAAGFTVRGCTFQRIGD